MKITKIITYNVDIVNAQEIFTTDLTTLLFEKLKKKFEHKCYRGAFISKVLRIVTHSAIVIKSNTVDGAGTVAVQFEVECIRYLKKELIPDVTVIHSSVNLTDNTLHFSNSHIKGMMRMGNESNRAFMNTIAEKSQIPIIANESSYNPGMDAITIFALPFTPQEFVDNPIFFICDTKMSDSMEKHGAVLATLEALNAEIKLHQKIKNEKSYKFFAELIYPYKQNFSTTAIVDEIEMKTVDEILEMRKVELIYSMLEYHNLDHFSKIPIKVYGNTNQRNKQKVPEAKSEVSRLEIDSKYTVIYQSLDDTLKFILTKRMMYLMAVRGMVESFDSAKTEKLIPFWQLYKGAKLMLK